MSPDATARRTIETLLCRQPGADPALLAGEILAALRNHGWQPGAAPREEWQRTSGPPADLEAVRARAAQCREELATALEAERLRPTPPRPAPRGEP